MGLIYIPPVIVDEEMMTQLQQEGLERETAKWKHALIMYVVGSSPSIGAIERFIAGNWSYITKPKVYYHNEGYILVHFSSFEERDEVLYSGPHTLNNKPVISKVWDPYFDFKKEVLRIIPLWIKLPNLPLQYWSLESLSRIGSLLGKHVYADDCTSRVDRITYACMIIEMDITQELSNIVKLRDPQGKIFIQEIIYDWKPN